MDGPVMARARGGLVQARIGGPDASKTTCPVRMAPPTLIDRGKCTQYTVHLTSIRKAAHLRSSPSHRLREWFDQLPEPAIVIYDLH